MIDYWREVWCPSTVCFEQVFGPGCSSRTHQVCTVVGNIEGNKKHICHYPGLSDTYSDYRFKSEPQLYGMRGFACEDNCKSVHSQKLWFLFGAIDIDAADNPNYAGILVEKCVNVLGAGPCYRTSRSGKGCHIIYSVDPYKCDYSHCMMYGKALVAPYVKQLNDDGIVTCATGLANFWMLSSNPAHKTVRSCTTSYPLPVLPEFACIPIFNSKDIEIKRFDGLGALIIRQLIDGQIIGERDGMIPARFNINVRVIQKLLNGIVEFNTKAKGRGGHEDEPNGFMEFNKSGEVTLVSNADNNSVLLRIV